MKQLDFDAFCRLEAEYFSGGQSHNADESLDNSRRDGALSSEPVGDQAPMTRQTLGDPLRQTHLIPAHAEPRHCSKTERAGFEPAVQLLTGHVFSKDAHSTTLPPLQVYGRQTRPR